MLREPAGRLLGRVSAYALLTYWGQDGRLGEPGSATEQRRSELLFGDGGTYQMTAHFGIVFTEKPP